MKSAMMDTHTIVAAEQCATRTPLPTTKRWQAVALIIAGWTFFGLFFASHDFLGGLYFDRPVQWKYSLATWLTCAYSWAIVTPLMLWVIRRVPLQRKDWPRALALHLIAAAFFSVLVLMVYAILRPLLPSGSPLPRTLLQMFQSLVVGEFHSGLLTYAAIVGIHFTLAYYRKYREGELQAAQLATQLTQSQLATLKSQLHPHFLFNTLNTIAILMEEDARSARNMLVQLSDLLRATLDKGATQEVTLKQELEFLQRYLEIEQMRFHDRLRLKIEIDPATLAARVPDLLLQPLVENAIRHGIAPRAAVGEIEIRARRANGNLTLSVRDNGAGLSGDQSEIVNKGVGIANTRARLKQLYGERHRFELQNVEGGGLLVSISIPFHTAEGEP